MEGASADLDPPPTQTWLGWKAKHDPKVYDFYFSVAVPARTQSFEKQGDCGRFGVLDLSLEGLSGTKDLSVFRPKRAKVAINCRPNGPRGRGQGLNGTRASIGSIFCQCSTLTTAKSLVWT